MITFTVKVDQGELKRTIAKGVRPTVREVALAIEAAMKLSMTGSKSGRKYRRRGVIHRASAPGEPPAVDTGFLINSIQTTIKSDTQAEIVIAADYAETLEFGSSKVSARPFVRPAIEGVITRFSKGGILARGRE